MKYLSRLPLFSLFLFLSCQPQTPLAPLTIDKGFIQNVVNCENATDSERFVYFIKQWHLGPKAVTRVRAATKFPQYTNQQAIYGQLVQWAEQRASAEILMEGCEGELSVEDKTRFNGFNLEELLKLPESELHLALTHLGLKFKAYLSHHPSQLNVSCGDSSALVQKHSLTFSDLRGYIGFYERLLNSKNSKPELYEKFLKGAREVLGLTDSASSVTEALRAKIVDKVEEFDELIQARNDVFLRQIDTLEGNVIVILGGVHAADFKEKLQARGVGCKILTPIGYPSEDESSLIKDLKAKFNHHPKRS